jgi:hypothetical protein
MGMMGQPPEKLRDEMRRDLHSTHKNPVAPRAGAEVGEEVESGETAAAAAAATNSMSDTRRRARGKREVDNKAGSQEMHENGIGKAWTKHDLGGSR